MSSEAPYRVVWVQVVPCGFKAMNCHVDFFLFFFFFPVHDGVHTDSIIGSVWILSSSGHSLVL